MSTFRNGTVDFDFTGTEPRVGEVEVGAFSIGLDHVTISIDAHIQSAREGVPPLGTELTIKAQSRHLRALAEGILKALDKAEPEIAHMHDLVPLGMHGS